MYKNMITRKPIISFMAVASGTESVEFTPAPKYTGVGTFNVLCVNPNKEELQKLYPHRDITEEPKYLIEKTEQKPRGARIDFYLQSIVEKNNGADFIAKVSYFLYDMPFQNNDKSKVQVIDAFGDTGWILIEDFKAKKLPENSRVSLTGIRPAFRGEEELTKFVKAFLNIPERTFFKDGRLELNPIIKKASDQELCYAQLENISKYFSGDFSELKQILKNAINIKVKLLTGVKLTADNKQYVDFYSRFPLKASVNNYNYLARLLMEDKTQGRYSTTEFGTAPDFPFIKFEIKPTEERDLLSGSAEASEDFPEWGI